MTVLATPYLVDSHCHLQSLVLEDGEASLANILQLAKDAGVIHLLCVCVELDDIPKLYKIAALSPDIKISVGVHPDVALDTHIDEKTILKYADHPACIAIGETGLDYYRINSPEEQHVQQARFREHIHAAISASKPLIIHTRQAAEDTLRLMQKENAAEIGGVMHCFTENWDIARRALDLNFYISISGIVTFKNAVQVQDVVKKLPLDRLLIETDSPYLAPVPFRGKQNHPALVKHVAEAIATLRGDDFQTIAEKTTENFYRCFRYTPTI